MNEIVSFSVTDFIAICNQVLDMSFGVVKITGELANFKISKNKWVYFDLKDEYSSLKFFGTIYQLPGPLEDGMVLTIQGSPSLHPKFGFSVSVQSIQLKGEGVIKKASQLLEQKLQKEGLFDDVRKRELPFAPSIVGVISSAESAGYADFIKIMNERWSGVQIKLYDVLVQGIDAPAQIVEAVEYFNRYEADVEVLVIIRGGGSADDLQAFSHEGVTRAVAGSRLPTLVAIGHEVDLSLAEKAADMRASTPSNASQLLFPDKTVEIARLNDSLNNLQTFLVKELDFTKKKLAQTKEDCRKNMEQVLQNFKADLKAIARNVSNLNPMAVLERGYVLVEQNGKIIKRAASLDELNSADVKFFDKTVKMKVSKQRKV